MTEVGRVLDTIAEGLAAGRLAPFLGPDCLTLDGPTPLPDSSTVLAQRLNAKVAVPGRIRGNVWAAAQWIESNKHRVTLVRLLQELFAAKPEPTALHHWLAGLKLPLIVDGWYDTLTADALTAAGAAFGQVQGVRRSGQSHEVPWVKYYDAQDAEAPETAAGDWPTLLYKPHGAVRPAANFLLSDSDYVEVLTEIDIQTPIPPQVIARRSTLGFVFLGCRFYDQMQRIFAHQIIKRSAGPHYAVLPGELSRNEARFLETENIQRLDLPLGGAIESLMAYATSKEC